MSFLHSLTPSQLLQGDDSPLNSAKPSKKMPVTGSEGVWTAADLSGEEEHLNSIIARYLLENVEEYRELSELRKQGWEHKAGDLHFQKQRENADKPNAQTKRFFYEMMRRIAREMQQSVGGLKLESTTDIEGPHNVLDMCMAPGGFLSVALDLNPDAHALAFSLPLTQGGHAVLLRPHPNVRTRFLDITMLAADMGTIEIPAQHPDSEKFLLSRQLAPGQRFDLVICDGQVLRTHKRAAYREEREAQRLTTTQLALGLEHVKTGGTMVMLLHKVEAWRTVFLLHTFSKFASLKLFKPSKSHATRSSFYMIATDIQREQPEVESAIGRWKMQWSAATFGTDEECKQSFQAENSDVKQILEDFGPKLVELGREVWITQARALKSASFMKKRAPSDD